MLCDYAQPLSHERCRGSGSREAARKVTVTYSEVESDELHLCLECARWLATDARRHGYKVATARLS